MKNISHNRLLHEKQLKKFRYQFIALLCATSLGMTANSCGNDDKDEPNPDEPDVQVDPALVGTWGDTRYLSDPSDYNKLRAFQFSSDGTGIYGPYVLHTKEFGSDTEEFTYTSDGSVVTIIYTEDNTVAKYEYAIQDTYLYLDSNGTTSKYVKL